jgi:hypothetical protein
MRARREYGCKGVESSPRGRGGMSTAAGRANDVEQQRTHGWHPSAQHHHHRREHDMRRGDGTCGAQQRTPGGRAWRQ